MKISVLVITYNQQSTIRRALDSIVSQEFDGEWEVIVGDDASSDATPQICLEYALRYPGRIRVMPASPNKGLVDNYFDCLLAAKGEYVTDCAGDDYWPDAHRLQRMADMLDANPEAVCVYSDYIIEDTATGKRSLASANPRNVLGKGGVISSSDLLVRALNPIDSLPYNLSASMFRRDTLMALYAKNPDMLRNKAFGCEDLPVIAALASAGPGVYLDTPTIVYEVNDGSVSNGGGEERQVRFYVKSMHASAVLGEYYGIQQSRLRDSFLHKSHYVVSLAFNSGNPDLRDLVEDALKEWRLTPSLITRLHLILMRNGCAWGISRRVKNMLKLFKSKYPLRR